MKVRAAAALAAAEGSMIVAALAAVNAASEAAARAATRVAGAAAPAAGTNVVAWVGYLAAAHATPIARKTGKKREPA